VVRVLADSVDRIRAEEVNREAPGGVWALCLVLLVVSVGCQRAKGANQQGPSTTTVLVPNLRGLHAFTEMIRCKSLFGWQPTRPIS
jgi:hypothetical protein